MISRQSSILGALSGPGQRLSLVQVLRRRTLCSCRLYDGRSALFRITGVSNVIPRFGCGRRFLLVGALPRGRDGCSAVVGFWAASFLQVRALLARVELRGVACCCWILRVSFVDRILWQFPPLCAARMVRLVSVRRARAASLP